MCLGGVLVACGAGGGGGGYVAVQRPASGPAVAPTGDVELVPLEKPSASKGAAGSGTSVAASAPSGGSGAQVSGPHGFDRWSRWRTYGFTGRCGLREYGREFGLGLGYGDQRTP